MMMSPSESIRPHIATRGSRPADLLDIITSTDPVIRDQSLESACASGRSPTILGALNSVIGESTSKARIVRYSVSRP